jgi:hypothetical protein
MPPISNWRESSEIFASAKMCGRSRPGTTRSSNRRRRDRHQAKVSVSPPRIKAEMNCCRDDVVQSGKWVACRFGRLGGQSRRDQAIARSGMGIPVFSHSEKCPEVFMPTVALQNCIMLRNS